LRDGRSITLTNVTAAEGDKGDLSATQDDLARVIESIRLRDQRIIAAEAELRALKQDLDRISDENRKMREEALPIMRLMKDQRTPLPDPAGGTIPSPRDTDPSKLSENLAPVKESKGSSLSRKFSTKKLFLGSAPKQTSPTHPPRSYTPQPREVRDDTGTHLEASAAAMAASSHLTASMTAQTSPNGLQSQQLSPTSPAYSNQPSSAGSYHNPPGSAAGRNFPREATRHDRGGYSHPDDTGTGFSSQASTLTGSWPQQTANDQASIRRDERDRARRQAPTPSPRDDDGMRERDRGGDRYVAMFENNLWLTHLLTNSDSDNPQVEIFKSFRVAINDPCEVVLPVVSFASRTPPFSSSKRRKRLAFLMATYHRTPLTVVFSLSQALKRYNIHDDWRQYALYIVHGDQERCLGLKEKPLLLFKQLDKEGRKPMFMLRRHASPQDGWSGAANSGGGGTGGGGGGGSGGGFDAASVNGGGGTIGPGGKTVPGGVL
jgi:hypothetical protein